MISFKLILSDKIVIIKKINSILLRKYGLIENNYIYGLLF
ncbi:MAG: hypothetical protein JETT_2377 [Candidatus Jettenia ecosi]|uniref:Uncharacterized protein n=1 Tax=Candidatus Jettenia ecosi TaxID=2494326 RepID=A0A533QLC1_9BACT|nr:MAG: hypothetical protein JETT_2377 [Candidatus Jettenia ecosi]